MYILVVERTQTCLVRYFLRYGGRQFDVSNFGYAEVWPDDFDRSALWSIELCSKFGLLGAVRNSEVRFLGDEHPSPEGSKFGIFGFVPPL